MTLRKRILGSICTVRHVTDALVTVRYLLHSVHTGIAKRVCLGYREGHLPLRTKILPICVVRYSDLSFQALTCKHHHQVAVSHHTVTRPSTHGYSDHKIFEYTLESDESQREGKVSTEYNFAHVRTPGRSTVWDCITKMLLVQYILRSIKRERSQ